MNLKLSIRTVTFVVCTCSILVQTVQSQSNSKGKNSRVVVGTLKSVDAAGLPMPTDRPLDGKSIIPALQGKTDQLHDALYWSSAGAKGKWAIRSGDWKLVAEKERFELFDLSKDLSETTDVAAKHPKRVSELTDKYNAWLDEMADPVSNQGKRWEPNAQASADKKSREGKKATRLNGRESK